MRGVLQLGWLLAGVALAGPAAAAECEAAADQTARDGAVPAALLRAIAQVESAGRPWSVNVDGRGQSFAAKQDAIDYVRQALAAGARFIDVGCFQVDLQEHPDAFDTLDAAFDPALNAAYAARLLVTLRGGQADWNTAVASYHSADPARGGPYRARVLGWLAGAAPGWTGPGAAPGWSDAAAGAAGRTAGAPRRFAGVLVIEPGMAAIPGLPRVYAP